MIVIEGSFFHGGRSGRQPATLSINQQGQVFILLNDEQKPLSGPNFLMPDLQVSARLGNTPRFIDFPNQDRFETTDNEQVDQLMKTHQQGVFNRVIHQLETHFQFVLLVVFLVSVFVWASIKYGVPILSNVVAQSLPVETSEYLGKGTLEFMDKTAFSQTELTVSRQKQLTVLFQRYFDDYPEYSLQVKFRKAESIGANALALPDGTIVFTDEMIELAEDDKELVAILGHEIGHVVHRHLLRRIIQSSGIGLVLVIITGDVSAASSLIVSIPAVLLELSFSREFEREADDFALAFLQRYELNPEYFATIMLRLTDSFKPEEEGSQTASDEEPSVLDQLTPYLSTHPMTDQRIQQFKAISSSEQ